MSETFLTAAEVAQLLKLNVETVYRLIDQQGLPAARIGHQWRFEEGQVRQWFNAQQKNVQTSRQHIIQEETPTPLT